MYPISPVEVLGSRYSCPRALLWRFEGLRAAAMLGHERVDHGPCDADPGRERREVVYLIPAGVFYLLRVHSKLAASVIGSKPNHQRVRERPRLASKVSHVRDLNPDLL